MPRLDGFGLIAYVTKRFPDIPVIVMTAYSTAGLEKFTQDSGAISYIEKPFVVEGLVDKILTSLKKESEGGTLHGISSGMFLQFVEMERKTCTIRILENHSREQGVLFFKKGELVHARTGAREGVDAAHRILAWDDVTLSIQNDCPELNRTILKELQALLLEAMRLKDEAIHQEHQKSKRDDESKKKALFVEESSPQRVKGQHAREQIAERLKRKSGIKGVVHDESWARLLDELGHLAAALGLGAIKWCYVDRAQSFDYLIVPGKETTVILLDPVCSRDEIMGELHHVA
jgi:CheY-like chemotaxis protein